MFVVHCMCLGVYCVLAYTLIPVVCMFVCRANMSAIQLFKSSLLYIMYKKWERLDRSGVLSIMNGPEV